MKKTFKPVFEMSQEELAELLTPPTQSAIKEAFDKGLPVTYQDKRCPTDAHYIEEYKDGKIMLVLFDPESRTSTPVKDLTNG